MPFPCPYCDTVGTYRNNLLRHLTGINHPGHNLTDEQAESIIEAMELLPLDNNRLSVEDTNDIAGVNLAGDTRVAREAVSPEPPAEHKVRGLWVDRGALPAGSMDLLEKLASLVMETKGAKGEILLDLQIRDGYVNIYYRGGNLWKIEGLRNGNISFRFDSKYSIRQDPTQNPNMGDLPEPDAAPAVWLDKRVWLQGIMDAWFAEHPKEEREVQQRLCSNHLQRHDSEWVILDMEYAAWLHGLKRSKNGPGRRLCRFDFIAFKRKKPMELFLVELKLSEGSMEGSSGARSHAEDFKQFLSRADDSNALDAFRKSMRRVLEEKAQLGLLPGVVASEILKDKSWPSSIRPIFCLGAPAAGCLGSQADVNILRGNIERILNGLYIDPLWVDLNFESIWK